MRAAGCAGVRLAVVLLLVAADAAAEPGSVRGSVALDLDEATLADVGPMVVFLESVDATPLPGESRQPLEVRQRGALFQPPFLAISVGETVEMPNEDAIYHNVFSLSKPNDFDLGLYPAGDSRSVKFRHAGVVKTHCSIHESMSGTIFVAPSRYFGVVSASGSFEIRHVAPGSYRLRSWCERLPDTQRAVEVNPGRVTDVEIRIGPEAP